MDLKLNRKIFIQLIMKDFLIRKIASSSSFVTAHSHSNFIEINGQSRLEDSRWTNSLEKCTEFILQSHSVLRPWGPYLVREFPRYSDYFYLDTLSNDEESVTGGFFICKIELSETDWGYREWIVYITNRLCHPSWADTKEQGQNVL